METSKVIFCANQIYRNSLRLNCCFLVLVANKLYFFLKNLPHRKKPDVTAAIFRPHFWYATVHFC